MNRTRFTLAKMNLKEQLEETPSAQADGGRVLVEPRELERIVVVGRKIISRKRRART
jgi:hypothetical protein